MIINLGSINVDHLYDLPRLPAPGETVAATGLTSGLGGKGANQSVAAALAGARVRHVGAVGPDGPPLVDRLAEFGIDTSGVRITDTPTGHAIVMVDVSGENQIVIYSGANMAQDIDVITRILGQASRGDWLMLQNETSLQAETAAKAQARGMNVAYSAAPFDVQAVEAVLPHVTLLIVNQVEAEQLVMARGTPILDIPVPNVLVTKGAKGADWHDTHLRSTVSVPAFQVTAIDTTGAGDTFAGYVVAGLSQGLSPRSALRRASAAAAISVTRKGTSDAIPSLAEVQDFLGQLPANGAEAPQS